MISQDPFNEHVKVKIVTSPIQLKEGNELYDTLQSSIQLRLDNIIDCFKLHPSKLTDADFAKNWADAMTEHLNIPVIVKVIYYGHDCNSFDLEHSLTFCIEMTQDIIDEFDNRYKSELMKLVDEL